MNKICTFATDWISLAVISSPKAQPEAHKSDHFSIKFDNFISVYVNCTVKKENKKELKWGSIKIYQEKSIKIYQEKTVAKY